MKKLLSIWLFTLLLAAWAEAADQSWVEIRSPHFRVISNGSEKQARQVALGFERIRAAFSQGFPNLRTDSGSETIVLAPKDEPTMKSLLPRWWENPSGPRPAGLFRKGWEKDYAIVRLDQEGDNYSTVYHEYIHKLLGLNFPRLPLWLNEGLAEFFGNAEFRRNKTAIGVPSPRLQILLQRPPFPLRELMAASESSALYRGEANVQMFYAESWGLTHFLIFGKGMANGERFNNFLDALRNGADGPRAFREAFGDPEAIEPEFALYLKSASFHDFVFKKPIRMDQSALAARTLSITETHTRLGGFYTYFRELDAARQELTEALAENPNLALAHENLAFLLFQTGRDEEAQREFSRAATLDPKSFLSFYYRAMLENGGKTDAASLAKLDSELEEALQLNPRFAPALVARSRIYVRQRKLAEALAAALRAEKLEPDRAGYHTQVAEILLLERDVPGAIRAANYVAGRWLGPDGAEALSALNRARRLGGIPATPEEQAEEAKDLAYASGTTAAEGIIESVSCIQQGIIEVVLSSEGKDLAFRPAKNFGLAWSDTVWFGSDHFNPCFHLKGMKAVARYERASGVPGPVQLRWLEIRNDLSSGAPPEPSN